jgi:hypothetical protein
MIAKFLRTAGIPEDIIKEAHKRALDEPALKPRHRSEPER